MTCPIPSLRRRNCCHVVRIVTKLQDLSLSSPMSGANADGSTSILQSDGEGEDEDEDDELITGGLGRETFEHSQVHLLPLAD